MAESEPETLGDYFDQFDQPEGRCYVFSHDSCNSGSIGLHPEEEPRWTYRRRLRFRLFRWLHPLPWPARGGEFILCDPAGAEVVRVRPANLTGSRFEMTMGGDVVCRIRRSLPFWTKYWFDFSAGRLWVFRLPLFMYGRYGGESDRGEKVRIIVVTHNSWAAVLEPESNELPLVAAVAFMHREHGRT